MCRIVHGLGGGGGGGMGAHVSRQSWQEHGAESLVMPREQGIIDPSAGIKVVFKTVIGLSVILKLIWN